MRDLTDDIEEFRQVAITELVARPDLRRKACRPRAASREVTARSRRARAESHVGVLRVGDDEGARARIRFDFSELGVEGFHAKIPKSECRRPNFRARSGLAPQPGFAHERGLEAASLTAIS